jgi:DNA-binding LytR/AlgR family response regulator
MSIWDGLLPTNVFVRLGRSEIIQLARVRALRWTSRDVNTVSFEGSDSSLPLGRTSALRLKVMLKDSITEK